MPIKKTPENDPYRLVTHENGFREWIGTPTEEQENWILSHAVGVKSFSSARSRSAESAVLHRVHAVADSLRCVFRVAED